MKVHDPEARELAFKRLRTIHRVYIKDAAMILNLHAVTVTDYVHQGKINAVRIGRRFYITEAEINRFIEHGPIPKGERV